VSRVTTACAGDPGVAPTWDGEGTARQLVVGGRLRRDVVRVHVVGEVAVVVVEGDAALLCRGVRPLARRDLVGGAWRNVGRGRLPDARGLGARWRPGPGGDGAIVAVAVTVAGRKLVARLGVAAAAVVEALARWRWCLGVGGRVLGVELVEVGDDVVDLREVGDVDLAAANEVEDDLAELGEGVGAAAAGEGVVEAGAAFADAALEDVADRGSCGADQRAERAAEFGGAEAATTSLPCHVVRVAHLV
jgi:hypothetical protein